MYQNQQHYQYQQQPPQQQQQQQQQQNNPPNAGAAPPPPAPVSTQQPQQHTPAQAQAQQGQYQGYAYPPPPQHPPPHQPAVPPQGYFPNAPASAYSYAVVTPQGYYYPPPPYQSPYVGQPMPVHPNPFSGPGYLPPPSSFPPHVAPYPPQPYQSNGYYPSTSHQYHQRAVSGHSSAPPTKRQRTESKAQQPNANHNHKHPRIPNKEKKTFSDFRVSKIKIGNFTSDESRLDADVRDSRLRFYFRSAGSHPSPSPALPPTNIAAQCPDRLSVSLHKGTQRILLPATHLNTVTFNRAAGYVKIEGDGWAAFEEVRADDTKDSSSVTSESGAGPKFIGTDIDPTGGEWEKAKVMEIWLDTQNPLTEPKWARGNLRDNIDPTSLFQNIIQVADPSGVTQQVTSFAGILDTWRDRSTLGTPELRNNFTDLLTMTEKLVQLLERTVHMTHMGLEPAVTALLALIPNKDTLHGDLKHIIMGLPYESFWKALESIMLEDLSGLRQNTHSGGSLASVNTGTKREREPDHDEDMELTSNGKASSVQFHEGSAIEKDASLPDKDTNLPDQSAPTSAVDHSEVGETVSNAPTGINHLGDDEITGNVGDDLGMDFKIPDEILEGIEEHAFQNSLS